MAKKGGANSRIEAFGTRFYLAPRFLPPLGTRLSHRVLPMPMIPMGVPLGSPPYRDPKGRKGGGIPPA